MFRPYALAAILVAACGGKPPPPPVEPPRLAAEEACDGTGVNPATDLPVPPRPPADPYRVFSTALVVAAGPAPGHAPVPVTHVCDLADDVLVIAAEQRVEGGRRVVGGRAWWLPRGTDAMALATLAIDPASPGCRAGEPTCTWKTSSRHVPAIETMASGRLPTSGWVHGLEDTCRALPDDVIAFCRTATRLAYVEVGCARAGDATVALQLGVHDTTLPRRFDLDVEVPAHRLYGAAEVAQGTTYRYAFTAGDRRATLALDLAASSAELTLDGAPERCLAFGLYRR